MNPMNFLKNKVVLIKGAGEKASAVAHRLHQAGLNKIVMTDLPVPLAERRGACFCEAIIDGHKQVSGVLAQRAEPSLTLIRRFGRMEGSPYLLTRKPEFFPCSDQTS